MNGSNSNTAGATVVSVTFKPKAEGDCLSDSIIEELTRRFDGTIQLGANSDIDGGISEPTDKTKIWWPIDTTTGVRIGQPRVYDTATATWIPLGLPQTVTLPKVRFGSDSIAAAAFFEKEVIFEQMPTDDYFIWIGMTTKVGSTFNVASANMDDFNFEIISREKNKFKVAFFNIPTGGLGFEWKAEEKS